MKVRIHNGNNGQKVHNSYLLNRSLDFIKTANERNLAQRGVSALLLATLLLPLVFFGQARTTAAQTASIANQLPAPVSAPPVPFLLASSSSGSLANTPLSTAYKSVAGIFTTPTLPEGFAMAKVPTVWERTSTSLAASISSLTASVAPLLFVSPNNSASVTKTGTNETEAEAEAAAAPPVAALVSPTQGMTKFDFDGDEKADASRWQPSTGEWKIKQSLTNSISTLTQGTSAATIAPADYDGDGITDRAVFDSSTGTWTIKRSSDGGTQTITGFGQWGDKAVSGDYVGDSKAEIAVWRPSNGTWYVKELISGTVTTTAFGAAGDIPAVGNYDGDLKMDYVVFRPSTGIWHSLMSNSNYAYGYFQWGAGTDTPVPADYDGDGRTDYAVYRPSNGTWYAFKSSATDSSYLAKAWGNYGDQPVPADYDEDGKDDFAVWRPTTGVWYIVKSSDPTFETYQYETLGQAGDAAAPSVYIKQIGGQVQPYGLAKARLSPKNATGGTDLYSRNFGWGTGLVGLPGRAGLDAGFGISYNSLVWTKQFGAMIFDSDSSNVSPGFRFGYPTIEPSYYDSQTGKFSYLMVTPSGKRIEFRQVAASNIYETADSSYTQLTFSSRLLGGQGQPPPVEDGSLTVTGTDGTQMTYLWKSGAFRCSQIKDSNGNFITINHDDYGLLRSVTDTLGRVINVEYDSQLYPTSIKQTWKGNNGVGGDTTHPYATFTYTNITIGTNFVEPSTSAAIPVVGPPNGTVLKVLQKIAYPSGGYTTFEYNGYGQVWKTSNHAADNHLLNSVRTDLQNAGSAAQSDCPRFSETRTFVENFNIVNGQAQETVVRNTFAENQNFAIGGETGLATKVEVSMDNAPHNLISRTWFHGAGNWSEGLAFASEDLSGGVQKRWTRAVWTQDDPTLGYILNPRVVESKVGDEANVKRTEINYHPIAQGSPVAFYGLVSEVKLYDAAVGGTLLKRATSDYVLDTAYFSRRLIGLPLESKLFDGTGNLMSKTIYGYDGSDFSDLALEQNISTVIQHDNINYGATFITGRGNMTSVTRCDATISSGPNCGSGILSQTKYNTAGAPVAQIDPLGRTVKISYADSFNDDINTRNTFAYPTGITTAGAVASTEITSYVKYRFDIGANVEAESPGIGGQARAGKRTKRLYDDKGRLERQTLLNNGAYTRYQYFANQVQSKVFTTVTSGAGEVASESWTDGAGRVLRSRNELPNSSGGWSGSLVEYDILGQVNRQSVPTEINGSWTPSGDDNRGVDAQSNPIWLWTYQKYDWKGRVIRKIATDGADTTALNPSDVLINYEGCGCAGGLVTTIQGEEIIEKDWQGNNPQSLGRRTQKIYQDIQGRTEKTQVMEWNGTTPYTSVKTTFNGRDQAISVKQYQGDETGSLQETLMTYDGFGRLKTQHRPEQDANKSTVYNYNTDDSISSVVDARQATTNYAYSTRGLVEQISYGVPTGSTILPAQPVGFIYDALGNRTKMTDGLGTIDYEYNDLSQMTAETRQFTDTLANAPTGGFKLTYTYTLSGQLKSYKDPYGQQFNYAHDKTGRLLSVTGVTAFAGITDYADNPQYRAWGGLESLDYGNDTQMTMTFNNRLQADNYKLTKTGQTQPLMSKDYEFYADGNLRKLDDALNDKFDRMNKFDHVGHLKQAKSGIEARDTTVSLTEQEMSEQLPYRQSYQFNAFGNMIERTNLHWGVTLWNGESNNINYTYENNRITNTGWQHDADGRVTVADTTDLDALADEEITWDAAGRLAKYHKIERSRMERFYNGTGREEKRKEENWVMNTITGVWYWAEKTPEYFIRSSVFGGEVISEIDSTGKKKKTYVRGAGAILAWQTVDQNTNPATEYVNFQHQDAAGLSYRSTKTTGTTISGEGGEGSPAELDPMGGNVGMATPYTELSGGGPFQPEIPTMNQHSDWAPMRINGQGVSCMVDGVAINCVLAIGSLGRGSADLDFATSSSWITNQLGISRRAIGNNDAPVPPGGDPDAAYATTTYEYYFTGTSWLTPRQTQSQRATKPNLNKLQSAVDFCARTMFGVSLTGGSWTDKGGTGQMEFEVLSGGTVPSINSQDNTFQAVRSFIVTNDAKTFSKSNLRAVGMHYQYPDKKMGIYSFDSPLSPGTLIGTNTTYTANDRETGITQGQAIAGKGLGISPFNHTQIHEAGNALAAITGKSYSADSSLYPDRDSGQAFEVCVLDNYRVSITPKQRRRR